MNISCRTIFYFLVAITSQLFRAYRADFFIDPHLAYREKKGDGEREKDSEDNSGGMSWAQGAHSSMPRILSTPNFCQCLYFFNANILSALGFKDDYLLNLLLMIVFCVDHDYY